VGDLQRRGRTRRGAARPRLPPDRRGADDPRVHPAAQEGALDPGYFEQKYGVKPLERFRDPLDTLEADGYLAARSADRIALNRDGLLRVDVLLQRFFLPEHAGIRYTYWQ
jgi:hypothetical protein